MGAVTIVLSIVQIVMDVVLIVSILRFKRKK